MIGLLDFAWVCWVSVEPFGLAVITRKTPSRVDGYAS
jgi:hypothetical protein